MGSFFAFSLASFVPRLGDAPPSPHIDDTDVDSLEIIDVLRV